MKLFQIEELDGAPVDADAPGVAVGIDIAPGNVGRVAIPSVAMPKFFRMATAPARSHLHFIATCCWPCAAARKSNWRGRSRTR